jgi:hypothetical protein
MVTKIAVPDEYGRRRDVAFITPSKSRRAVLPAPQIEDACTEDGLIAESQGHFDSETYENQTWDLGVRSVRREPSFIWKGSE